MAAEQEYVVVDGIAYPKGKEPSKKKNKKNKKVVDFVKRLRDRKPKKGRLRLVGLALFVFGFLVSGVAPGLASFMAWIGLILIVVVTIKKFMGDNHSWMSVLALILYATFGAICLFMMYQSSYIYADLFSSVDGSSTAINWGDLGASNASQIWLIGPLFAAFLRFIAGMLQSLELTLLGVTGILVYLVIQTFEVLPLIFELSPDAKKQAIEQLRKFEKVQTRQTDSEWTARLAESYNNRYEAFFTRLYYAMFIAYVVDLTVCLIKASPLKGGWAVWPEIKFLFWQNVPAYLDFQNIFRIFAAVAFFTIVFLLMIMAKEAGFIFSGADEED